jgi:hypothetical protein
VVAFEIVEHDVLDLTHDKNDTKKKIDSELYGKIKIAWLKMGLEHKALDAQARKTYGVPILELTQDQGIEFLEKLGGTK